MNKVDRKRVFDKYNGHCAYCGCELKSIKDMQVDHVIPQAFFQSHVKNQFKIPYFLKPVYEIETDINHPENLMPACRICNKWKSAFDLELFRSEINEQIKRLNEYNANYRLAKRYGLIQETIKPIVFYFEVITR